MRICLSIFYIKQAAYSSYFSADLIIYNTTFTICHSSMINIFNDAFLRIRCHGYNHRRKMFPHIHKRSSNFLAALVNLSVLAKRGQCFDLYLNFVKRYSGTRRVDLEPEKRIKLHCRFMDVVRYDW